MNQTLPALQRPGDSLKLSATMPAIRAPLTPLLQKKTADPLAQSMIAPKREISKNHFNLKPLNL